MKTLLRFRRGDTAFPAARHTSIRFRVIVGALACLSIVGCGRKAVPRHDANPMAKPVTQLADAAENAKHFRQLFVASAAPDEKQRKRYAEAMYMVTEVHPTSDSEAELRVKVLDGNGGERGEMTWSVVRDGGKWRLKSAPLP
jgi:hypothetical protein